MIVHGNQMAHIEARTPSIERRFVGWSGNPWTPEQMGDAGQRATSTSRRMRRRSWRAVRRRRRLSVCLQRTVGHRPVDHLRHEERQQMRNHKCPVKSEPTTRSAL